jgi:KDO2-lipid IV(A) lauroyltransferase
LLPKPNYVAYRTGSALARLLPGGAVPATVAGAGRVAAAAMAGRRRMVERHQLRVRPDLTPRQLERAVDHVFQAYADYWIESFRLPGTPPAEIDRGFRAEGFDVVADAYEAGTGVILALPHLGLWEWAGFWLSAVRGYRITAVAEPVDPPELADWFIGLRRDLGMDIVTLGPDAGGQVARALKDGHILALLCDRDIAGGGVEVEFFGERTTLPAGPATLALRSEAPLVPAAVYREPDGSHLGLARPPIDTTRQGKLREDVARITQDLARELEWLIRRAPEQWHLLQPNWPSDRA